MLPRTPKLEYRTAPGAAADFRTSSARLELRRLREGVIVVRASNDTVVDEYGKIITVEALHDWAQAFLEHRNVNLQHNLDLRGIKGKHFAGVATRLDFTPQLEVEIRVTDPETMALIDAGKITSASLEFVPIAEGIQVRTVDGREVEVYTRIAMVPEATGLGLVDVPGVPGTDILEVRSGLSPNWTFAVIDPKVLNGEITDPTQIEALRWFPHHETTGPTRPVLETQMRTALDAIDRNDFTVPPNASLTRTEIIRRARAHLARHSPIALRTAPTGAGEVLMNKQQALQWIQMRASQLVLEGRSQAEAETAARAEIVEKFPQIRTVLEQADPVAPAPAQVVIRFEGLEQRSAPAIAVANPAVAAVSAALASVAATAVEVGAEAVVPVAPVAPDQAQRENLLAQFPEIRALLNQPENPLAAIAGGMNFRGSNRLEPDALLAEVMVRTVAPLVAQRQPTAAERQEVDNILRAHGIDVRALTIEGNGVVVYNELARQFIIKPQPETIGRNHFASVPMGGVKKRTYPRFDRGGITHEWNRVSTVGIGESDGTPTTFDLEVTELNSKCVIPDSFSLFNAQGTSFIQSVLLPAMRSAGQYEEDKQFFLSSGVAPNPTTFKGLKNQTGVTVVASSANGDAFVIDLLTTLLRVLPVQYRGDIAKLAYYLPVRTGDDYGDILAARQTPGGDGWMTQFVNKPGPLPIGVHRGIPIFTVPHSPTNETQGTSVDAGTIHLVHRDIPVIGDALSLKIEPYRRENFIDVLQLQEFVGLGYQWPEGVVRRAGVRPK